VLEVVEINDMTTKPLPVQQRHWLKKLLLETMHSCLGIFSEAVSSEHGYRHWVENAVQFALFKEIFEEHFMVRAVLISLRPFHSFPFSRVTTG